MTGDISVHYLFTSAQGLGGVAGSLCFCTVRSSALCKYHHLALSISVLTDTDNSAMASFYNDSYDGSVFERIPMNFNGAYQVPMGIMVVLMSSAVDLAILVVTNT